MKLLPNWELNYFQHRSKPHFQLIAKVVKTGRPISFINRFAVPTSPVSSIYCLAVWGPKL
ncbi:hypothetical protein NQ317_000202 [Molorchus minor]|uniref:Uncharacterized protein n=1 Tax=Molorchus minor TaxID=1323400 RepID=A0ABQ9JC82_9CUCU|nr:hypothetical protein NQ317_000202 [Molorchus minor]